MVKQAWDEGKGGAIVNMSSVNAVLAIPNQVPYVVSKGGINQLTRVAAIALAPYRIRVNAIGPGTIMTELARTAVLTSEESRKKILSRSPLGRCGEPEEVASVAAFLRDHPLRGRLPAQEHRLQVDREHAVEVLLFEIEKLRHMRDPGVIEENVDPLVTSDRLGDNSVDIGLLRNIATHRRRLVAFGR
jgi:hypothetical protein